MKLTDLLINKKFGQCKNIDIESNQIVFNDIKAILPLNNWQCADLSEFDNIISKYSFPKKEEFKKKDRDAVRDCFPKPQIILKKNGQNDIRIALALYPKKTLTGNTLLHLRSINKFEQMEIRYFLKFTSAPINEPKIKKRGFYEFCQSSDIIFDYDFIEDSKINSARLRIITCGFNDYVLLLYAFDRNETLDHIELESLAESFKSFT
ncbi:hypothetical protein [Flavobacterium macrobrachii]|uniref:hypothetical protein n=1 Tax=Flavobacterium macrobrachii TaxID=591204 RepID=UPI0037C01146